MAAARELELEVDLYERCLRCTVDNKRDQDIFSSQFGFEGVRFKLRYVRRGTYYTLYLHKYSGVLHHPLGVMVHVESPENGGIVKVLPDVRCFRTDDFGERNGEYGIWRKTEEQILLAIPEFRMNGVLKLSVVLKAEGGEVCICALCKFTATNNSVLSLESFLKDLGNLLHQNASTDVELRVADADGNILTTVRAHKILVCARSPVLAAMFRSDMVEGRTGVATVKDVDAGVFEEFIKYLYSGKLDDETTVDAAMSLYEVGDRFQVKGLTRHCAKWMVRNLTNENSFEVLLLSDAHCDAELVEAIVTFMANRGVERAFDGWEDFRCENPSLAIRVMERSCELLKGMSPEGEYCCSKWRGIV